MALLFSIGLEIFKFVITLYFYVKNILKVLFECTFAHILPISPTTLTFETDNGVSVVNITLAMAEDSNITNYVGWLLWLYGNDYRIFDNFASGKRITICYDIMEYSELNSEAYNKSARQVIYFSVGDKSIKIITKNDCIIVQDVVFNQIFY